MKILIRVNISILIMILSSCSMTSGQCKIKGDQLYFDNNIAGSVKYYSCSLQDNGLTASERTEALYRRANALYSLNRRDEALSDLNEFIELGPVNANAYNTRGAIKMFRLDAGNAISDFKKAIEIDPELAVAYYNMGGAYAALNVLFSTDMHTQTALQAYGNAIRLEPDDPKAYVERGKLYNYNQQFLKALNDLNTAISLGSKGYTTYIERGKAHYELGRKDKALEDFNEALSIKPKDPNAHFLRAAALASLYRFEQAVASLDSTLEITPNHFMARHLRGDLHYRIGMFEKAVADLDGSGQLIDPCKLSTRGMSHGKLGAYKQAIADLTRAIELDESHKIAHYNMACVYSLMGEGQKACKFLDKSITLGYLEFQHIKSDPDLDNIRSSRCYSKIMKGR